MIEVTNYGHDMAFHGELSPSMERLLNAIETDCEFEPSNNHEEKLLSIAEEKGYITVI